MLSAGCGKTSVAWFCCTLCQIIKKLNMRLTWKVEFKWDYFESADGKGWSEEYSVSNLAWWEYLQRLSCSCLNQLEGHVKVWKWTVADDDGDEAYNEDDDDCWQRPPQDPQFPQSPGSQRSTKMFHHAVLLIHGRLWRCPPWCVLHQNGL